MALLMPYLQYAFGTYLCHFCIPWIYYAILPSDIIKIMALVFFRYALITIIIYTIAIGIYNPIGAYLFYSRVSYCAFV